MRALGPLLACLFVGAALGAGAVQWLAAPPPALAPEHGGVRTASGKSDVVDAGSPSALESSPPAVASVAAEREAAPASLSASAPASVIDDAVRAVRSAPPPPRTRGDRRLDGRVARADGSGVAGVVIRARRIDGRPREPGPPRLGLAPPPNDSLDRAVQRAVEAWYDAAAQRAETTSDAEGRYVLADLPAGRWWIEPWCEGFAIEVPGEGSFEVEPDATLDLLATPVERVAISVRLPDGSAPPRAAIALNRSGGNHSGDLTLLWTDAAREVAIKPGRYDVRATLGDPDVGPPWSEMLVSDWSALEVVAGATPPPLALALRGAPGIRGRVLWPAGARRGNAMIKVAPAPARAEPDLVALAQDGGAPIAWANQGSYTFRDLTPGRWLVGLARNWGEPIVVHAVVEVTNAMVVQDLVVPPADPAVSLVVKVTDLDGALVDDCDFQLQVMAAQNGGRSSGSGRAPAERKPNGNWWVTLGVVNEIDLAKPWPTGTTVQLTVSSARLGTKTVDLAPGTRALQVRFGAPARLQATIAGYVGSGYEGRLHLSLEPIADGAGPAGPVSWSPRPAVGADGTQLLGPVEAGTWRLSLQLQKKQAWQRRRVAQQDVTLGAGDNTATIVLPALSDLVVEAPGRSGTMQLQNVATKENDHQELDAEGRTTFSGLPPGDYTLQTFGGAFEMMQVRLPAGGPVRFEPMLVNAARVTITDRAGTLAALGFADGDLIVGIDGQEFESSMQMQIVLMQSIAKQKIVFVVERGGTRQEIELDPRQMMDGRKHGGTIEPTSR